MSLEFEKSIFDLLKSLYFMELANNLVVAKQILLYIFQKTQCISRVHVLVFLIYKLNSNVTSSMTLSEASPLVYPCSKF